MSMKQENTDNKNELKLTFTVEKERFEEAIQHVYKESAKYFNIPGFRKGKAPYKIVERYYGANIFYEDAFNELAPDVYDEELKDSKLEIVSRPKIDIVQMEKGKDLIFTAIVNTKPDFKLGKYKGIELEKTEHKVSDEEVEHELTHMADHNSRMVTVEDRACKKDDLVTIDFDGSVDGVPFDGGKAENYDLTLGSNTFIPGFEDQIIGMKIDEEKDVVVTFPEDYFEAKLAGKEATFKVKLHTIKYKEMPKIDDEFAKDVSEFDTLADLKKDIKKKKQEEHDHMAEHELEDKAVLAVCDNTEIDIPDGMIDAEIDNQVDQVAQRLQYQGLKLDQYLKLVGQTEKDLRDSFREGAKQNVKSTLVLEKIIEVEKIKADDKFVKEKLEEMSKQYNQDLKNLSENENLKEYLEKSSKTEAAVKFIIDNAKITTAKAEKEDKKADKKSNKKEEKADSKKSSKKSK